MITYHSDMKLLEEERLSKLPNIGDKRAVALSY